MKNIVLKLVVALALFGFALPQKKKTKVWMIGDSTMAIKDKRAYPEHGWGMPFAGFFDSTIEVDNRAKNGRSTRTFMTEGLWKAVVDNLSEGDYVFIQFGHNDEIKTKGSATTEEEFSNYLLRYVNEAKAKGATPVLLTSVARRKFDSLGRIQGTHDVYAAILRKVAKENNVVLIDHDVKSQALLQTLGVETSKLLFNHLRPGQHPNYPDGKVDDTHFSELGARMMAEIVLAEIRNLKLDLANHIYQPPAKK